MGFQFLSLLGRRLARAPNKTLQRSWTHKLLGRGRSVLCGTHRLRARVLNCRRAAAELCR